MKSLVNIKFAYSTSTKEEPVMKKLMEYLLEKISRVMEVIGVKRSIGNGLLGSGSCRHVLRRAILVLLLLCMLLPMLSFADVPVRINYQGRYKESGVPITDDRHFEFKITNGDGGAQQWTSGDVTLTVTRGLFNYVLTPTGVDWRNIDAYLEVWVGESTPDTELTPHEKINASAYALYASSAAYAFSSAGSDNATTLAGHSYDHFVTTCTTQDVDGWKTFKSTSTFESDIILKGYLKENVDNDQLRVMGGQDTAKGGFIELYGKDNPGSYPGYLKLGFGGAADTGIMEFLHYNGSDFDKMAELDRSGNFKNKGYLAPGLQDSRYIYDDSNNYRLKVSTNIAADGTVESTSGGFKCPDGTVMTSTSTLGGGISGSGTSGKIAKFTSSTGIGTSTISDDGTNVSMTGDLEIGDQAVVVGSVTVKGVNGLAVGTRSSSQGTIVITRDYANGYWEAEAEPIWRLERNLGGAGKPGLGLGPGGATAVDTKLWRESAQVLRTNVNQIERDATDGYFKIIGGTSNYTSATLELYGPNAPDGNEGRFRVLLPPGSNNKGFDIMRAGDWTYLVAVSTDGRVDIKQGDLKLDNASQKIYWGGSDYGNFDEEYGIQYNGDATHPFQIKSASLVLGDATGSDYSTGRIYPGTDSARYITDDPSNYRIKVSTNIAADGTVESTTGGFKCPDGTVMTSTSTLGGGDGDMLKSTYDVDEGGVVDNSEALNGHSYAHFVTTSTNQTVAGAKTFSKSTDFTASGGGTYSITTSSGVYIQAGTLRVEGYDTLFDNNLIFTGTDEWREIRRSTNTGALSMLGGSSESNGAYLQAFGDSHSTNPGDINAKLHDSNSEFKIEAYNDGSDDDLAILDGLGNLWIAQDLTVEGADVKRAVDDSSIQLMGGTDNESAYFQAYGNAHASYPGYANVVLSTGNCTFDIVTHHHPTLGEFQSVAAVSGLGELWTRQAVKIGNNQLKDGDGNVKLNLQATGDNKSTELYGGTAYNTGGFIRLNAEDSAEANPNGVTLVLNNSASTEGRLFVTREGDWTSAARIFYSGGMILGVGDSADPGDGNLRLKGNLYLGNGTTFQVDRYISDDSSNYRIKVSTNITADGTVESTTGGFKCPDGTVMTSTSTLGGGGGLSGSGTATEVAFFSASDTLSSDTSFYWDNTNKRLGLHTKDPKGYIQISDKYIICDVFTSAGINAATGALGADGGEVYLPEGTYNISASIVIPQNNITLRGAGKGTILQLTAAVYCINLNGKDYITIKDLQIDGNGQNGFCVYGSGSTNCVLENLYLHNSNYPGVKLDPASNYNKIVNCDISSNGEHGIQLVGACYNTIADNAIYSNTFSGIKLESSSNNNTITGNTCYSNAQAGIYLTGTSNSNVITGNVCRENGGANYDGIYVATDYNTITGNTCEGSNGNQRMGIYLDNLADYNTVTGNVTKSHDTKGIRVWSSGATNNSVGGNVCPDGAEDLSSISTFTVTGNLYVTDTIVADGTIESTTGGFKCPDGTVMTSTSTLGGGDGDMLKSTYDVDEGGVVDNSEKLNGHSYDAFVSTTGDTMSGNLTVNADLTANNLKATYNIYPGGQDTQYMYYDSGNYYIGVSTHFKTDGHLYAGNRIYPSGQTDRYIYDDGKIGVNANFKADDFYVGGSIKITDGDTQLDISTKTVIAGPLETTGSGSNAQINGNVASLGGLYPGDWNNIQYNRFIADEPGNYRLKVSTALTVYGMVESTVDGFKCPDGTVMTSTSTLGGGGGLSGSGTSTQVAFFSDSSTLSSDTSFYWDNNNKYLGIGTQAPSSPLEINDGGGRARIELVGAGDTWNYSELTLWNDSKDKYWTLLHRQEAANINRFYIEEHEGANYYKRFCVEPGGNVGIGVDDPTRKLDVDGMINVSDGKGLMAGNDTNHQIILDKTNNKMQFREWGKFEFQPGSDATVDVVIQDPGEIGISTGNPQGYIQISDKYVICNTFTSAGINAAIDALGSGGGEVYLPEGTYNA